MMHDATSKLPAYGPGTNGDWDCMSCEDVARWAVRCIVSDLGIRLATCSGLYSSLLALRY
jgi:hypothetical protein